MLLASAKKLGKILLSGGCRRGLKVGVGASVEHKKLLQLLNSLHCRTVVDIGANRGQFALAVQSFIPDANVFSFEPLEAPAQRFRKLFAGVANIRLQQIAIGPARGEGEIHVSARDDSSSLLPISEIQENVFPGTGEIRIEKIRVERLSDVLSAADIVDPALLKLDVQGYEIEALKGCLDLLPCFRYACVGASFVEFYEGQALADEIIAFLREHGFQLAGVHNLCYHKAGVALQGDFFFAKSGEHFASAVLSAPSATAGSQGAVR
jgi:FkbM family methyltransferase